ncbi:glycoside hydrolase family 73 protein [Weissella koreensis]|uniref:glycoside hydrolase family 73 protein n=1 Tax=Weissella koreensis TaxID=165096 RepID=UPI00241D424B|nr:glucosaminidase domain-containing protein [Weissella koreensis]
MEDSTKKIILQSIGVTITTIGTFGTITNHQTASADNVQDFISRVKTGVKSASTRYNTWGSVMMAQAALESGWGKSDLATQANNYFGIKGTYNGQSVTMRTAEYDANGNIYYVDAQFRKYPSPTESMNDNGSLIRNGTSWNHAFYSGSWKENAKSYQAAANALNGKYATDPGYGSKLINIIQYNKFDKVVDNVTPAKYKVGQQIQISNTANQANNYNLRRHLNWVGTVKSTSTSNSGYTYSVDYGDGTHDDKIMEQNLKSAPAAKFKTGQKVQITFNAGYETNGYPLQNRRGSVGTIKSVKIKNHDRSNYEYYISYSDGTHNDHVAEQDISSQIINIATKYKVGQQVQINSNATNEANGYNLRNHQNWIGTIRSLEKTSASNSKFAYYIDYGDGTHNDHVLEQDLKVAPAAKFKTGQQVQITFNAGYETNGYSLQNRRGAIGTIKSVKIKNHDRSNYEYYISYSDGTHNDHVAEQDISSQIINIATKYKVGQQVQINSNATNEANGYNLRNHQNWIGTIRSLEKTSASNSKFAYYVDYGDGTHNDHVLEQDLKIAPTAKFKTGQQVKIINNAGYETNGYPLQNRRGTIGTIKSVKIKNHDRSNYEYYISYSNGTHNDHVAEQDLTYDLSNNRIIVDELTSQQNKSSTFNKNSSISSDNIDNSKSSENSSTVQTSSKSSDNNIK